MLTLLIHGPNALGKDIDVFLRPLVDELKELWNEGVVVGDAATKMSFWMRVVLLMIVNNFQVRNSLSSWSGQGIWHVHRATTQHLQNELEVKFVMLGINNGFLLVIG